MFSAHKYIELWKFNEVSLQLKNFEKCQNFDVSDIRFSLILIFNATFHLECYLDSDFDLNSDLDSDSDSDSDSNSDLSSEFNLDSDLSLELELETNKIQIQYFGSGFSLGLTKKRRECFAPPSEWIHSDATSSNSE